MIFVVNPTTASGAVVFVFALNRRVVSSALPAADFWTPNATTLYSVPMLRPDAL